MINHNNYFNVLPPQQILQANGKASIDSLRMSPNSSVLIADSTAPIVWKCISDGLGNVTSEAFDITPHKDEAQVAKENFEGLMSNINSRLERLEGLINEQSIVSRSAESDDSEFQTIKNSDAKRKKSSSTSKPNDAE